MTEWAISIAHKIHFHNYEIDDEKSTTFRCSMNMKHVKKHIIATRYWFWFDGIHSILNSQKKREKKNVGKTLSQHHFPSNKWIILLDFCLNRVSNREDNTIIHVTWDLLFVLTNIYTILIYNSIHSNAHSQQNNFFFRSFCE